MSTIGIDFGGTSTVAALYDGSWPVGYWRIIGDGMRNRIPHAVAKGLWASAAVVGGTAVSSYSEEEVEHPDVRLFWEGLAARLTSFLGRVEPQPRNGYEVVVALQTAEFLNARAFLEGLFRRGAISSLDGAKCIPASRALLYRWMAEGAALSDTRSTVLVIVAGDTLTSVVPYEVETHGDARRIVSAGRPWHIKGTGSDLWERAIAENIAQKANMKIPAGRVLQVRDGILAMAERLRADGPDASVRWTGPLSESMFHPFEINHQVTDRWKEVNTLKLYLPQALREAIREADSRSHVIVTGGTGACWPFIADVLASSTEFTNIPVWQSSNAIEDIARGAALSAAFSGSGQPFTLADEGPVESRTHSAGSQPQKIETSRVEESKQQPQSGSVLSRWTRKATTPAPATDENI